MSTPHACRGQRTWAPSDFCTRPLCGHTTMFSHYHLDGHLSQSQVWAVTNHPVATAAGARCEHVVICPDYCTFGAVGSRQQRATFSG